MQPQCSPAEIDPDRCLPSASPLPAQRPGKQKAAPKDRFNILMSLRKSGAGEAIRTLDPNLARSLALNLARLCPQGQQATAGRVNCRPNPGQIRTGVLFQAALYNARRAIIAS